MTDIQKLPGLHGNNGEHFRPETGPMQFGDDWPGIFIRGDSALGDAMMLEAALKHVAFTNDFNGQVARNVIESLIDTLRSCRVGDKAG